MFRSNVPASGLPEGWRPAQLADIAVVHGGGRLKLNKSHYIETGTRAYSAAGPDGFVGLVEGTAPSVVLSSIGARCGKAFLTDGPWTTLANTQVITPDPAVASASFLHGILDDETYWNRSGSAQPFIKPSDVKGAWVPLPPLDEQRRIAEVLRSIEVSLQSHRDFQTKLNGVIGRVRECLIWKGERSLATEPLSAFVSEMRNGAVYDARKEAGDASITRIETISNGQIDYDRVGKCEFSTKLASHRLKKGDILFSHINSVKHIGKTAIKRDERELYHGMNLMLLRADQSRMLPEFLHAVLLTDAARGYFREHARVAVNQASVNKKDIGSFEIPFPSLEDQANIISVLGSLSIVSGICAEAIQRTAGLKLEICSDLLSGRVRVPA